MEKREGGRERVCGRRVGGVWRDNLPPLAHQTPRHRRPIIPINEINHLQIYLAFSFITRNLFGPLPAKLLELIQDRAKIGKIAHFKKS